MVVRRSGLCIVKEILLVCADPEEREPEKEERTVTLDPEALVCVSSLNSLHTLHTIVLKDVDLNHCGLRRIDQLEELTQVEV